MHSQILFITHWNFFYFGKLMDNVSNGSKLKYKKLIFLKKCLNNKTRYFFRILRELVEKWDSRHWTSQKSSWLELDIMCWSHVLKKLITYSLNCDFLIPSFRTKSVTKGLKVLEGFVELCILSKSHHQYSRTEENILCYCEKST